MLNIKKILTNREIARLRVILHKELTKSSNSKYEATIHMFISDLETIAFHEHISSILYFLKAYRQKIDNTIKKKLEHKYFYFMKQDIANLNNALKKRIYKYKKNDHIKFLKMSQYFFSRFKHPLDLTEWNKHDYLNRVYLGLGFEFLLKAIYLKKGYVINKINLNLLKKEEINKPTIPVKSSKMRKKYLCSEVHELGYFIDTLEKITPTNVNSLKFEYGVKSGLKIVQKWRNSDIHVPTSQGYTNKDFMLIKSAYLNLYKLFLKGLVIPSLTLS
ncbi:MAG: hypothetical protein WC758_01565 [Candidatus Woesearchaeota archaeon]|jgi:hypothetical protein